MKQLLFAYSSNDGQTIKILKYIESKLTNFKINYLNLEDSSELDIKKYDFILIGGAIRYGHLSKNLYKFISKNKSLLDDKKAEFILVNLTSRKPEKAIPENSAYARKFIKKSAWDINRVTLFAGALHYPQYGLFDKYMIKLIMHITGGETDVTKDIEYTDWNKVATYAQQISNRLI